MNKIYKVVWSKVKNAYVVVSELAKNSTKGCSSKKLLAMLIATCVMSAGMSIGGGQTAEASVEISGNTSKQVVTGITDENTKSETISYADNSDKNRAFARGRNAIAIGSGTNVNALSSTAIGNNNLVDTGNAVPRKYKVTSDNYNGSIVLGNDNKSGTTIKDQGTKFTGKVRLDTSGDFVKVQGGGNAPFIERKTKDPDNYMHYAGSITVGNQNKNDGDENIVIGNRSEAIYKFNSNDPRVKIYSKNLGKENDPTYDGSGQDYLNRTITSGGVAIGSEVTISGSYSTAIGSLSNALNTSSVAIGNNATSLGHSSIAQGFESVAFSENSIAIGTETHVDGKNSIAVGYGNKVNGNNSGAFGDPSYVVGNNNWSYGQDNEIVGEQSLTYGRENKVYGENSMAYGQGNTIGAGNVKPVQFGQDPVGKATDENAHISVFGNNNTVTGESKYATILGNGNTITGSMQEQNNGLIAIGNGIQHTQNVADATILGNEANVKAAGGVALGSNSVATRNAASVAGKGAISSFAQKHNKKEDASHGEVNVGGRVVGGVATGVADTDAVNVRQWKSTTLGTKGDTGEGNVNLFEERLVIKGGAKGELSQNNIGVNVDGESVMNVQLAKDIKGLNSVESNTFKAGDVVIDAKVGINAGDKKITNVAPGEADTDAVNISQLKKVDQKVDNLGDQVANNTTNINKLGKRVDKGLAGAAALAALHPLDFDPDDKLTFAAGVGNYRGENAGAVGMFYRPDEKVMFSMGATVGNDNNMVNAGVSFSLDRTARVTNTKTAMAKEILDLREHAAKQDAQIAELIALVNSLTGRETTYNSNSIIFPDIPENHWAYEYVNDLIHMGIIEGYPDGVFRGERSMTRYEFSAMLWRALQAGVKLRSDIEAEFAQELARFRVDRIEGEDNDKHKVERIRTNGDKYDEAGNMVERRDHYGTVMEVEQVRTK